MHLPMSCSSIVSGLSMNDVFRFVFPGILAVIPFIIYLLTKDVLSDGVQRYAIIVSSFPVIGGYVVYGTNLGIIPYLFFIVLFIRQILIRSRRKEFWLLFVILGLGLIISHAVTSLLVAFLLVGIMLVLKSLEVISAKKRGFLTRPGDPKSLEGAIRMLYDDENLRKNMGSFGRKMVEKEFTVDKMVDETLKVYESLLS